MLKLSLFEFKNSAASAAFASYPLRPSTASCGSEEPAEGSEEPAPSSHFQKLLDRPYPLAVEELSLPVLVKMSVKIIKILDIDSNNNTFQCDFAISLKWEDNSFLPVVRGEVAEKEVDMSHHFIPSFDIVNLVALETQADPEFLYYRRKDTNTVRVNMKQRIRGSFFEHMELMRFPFDVQSLTVRVRARQDVRSVKYSLASRTKYPSVFSGSRFALPEWDFLTPKRERGLPGTPYVWVGESGRTTSAVKVRGNGVFFLLFFG